MLDTYDPSRQARQAVVAAQSRLAETLDLADALMEEGRGLEALAAQDDALRQSWALTALMAQVVRAR